MRASPYTYGSAYAACVLLSLMVPMAGGLMAVLVTANLIDELTTSPPDDVVRPELGEDEVGLYSCRCHERMGNDFWFLPRGMCLYGKKECDGQGQR